MLVAVADGKPRPLKEVTDQRAAASGLSTEQLADTIPSGQRKFHNRDLWTAT